MVLILREIIGAEGETRTRDLCRDRRSATRWTERNQSDTSAIVGILGIYWHGRQGFVQRIVQRLQALSYSLKRKSTNSCSTK